MPTIKDVAREAGVSIATVSYVLNNKTESISADTCRLVLAAAERIGYTPNITARNLRYNRAGLIGYAWHQVPEGQVNPVLDRFNYYLAQAAESAGYHVLTFTHPPDNPLPVYDELMRTGRVDAFVLAGTSLDDPRIRFLQDNHFPFVSFGRSNPGWDFPWVDTDGQAGVREAVEYLSELGHQRIAMITWPENDVVALHRKAGYLSGLRQAGIPIRPEYIFQGIHSEQTGRDAIAYWCSRPAAKRPTAIIAVSDLEAIGAMNEAERHGLTVGENLSIIGFDDVPTSQYLRPALTTFQQEIPEIGRAIMRMLEAILDRKLPEPRHVLIQPRFMIRASCSAPPR